MFENENRFAEGQTYAPITPGEASAIEKLEEGLVIKSPRFATCIKDGDHEDLVHVVADECCGGVCDASRSNAEYVVERIGRTLFKSSEAMVTDTVRYIIARKLSDGKYTLGGERIGFEMKHPKHNNCRINRVELSELSIVGKMELAGKSE